MQTLRRLLVDTASLYVWHYALAVFFMAIVAGATAATALVMENIVNDILLRRDETMLYVIAGIICSVYVLKGAATYGQLVTLGRINNSIVARLQRQLYDRLVTQTVPFYDRTEFGEIALRMGTCVHAAREALNLLILGLGRDGMKLIGLVGVMVAKDWQLSILVFLVGPPAILGVSILVRRLKKVVRVEMDSFAKILNTAKETKTGIRVIKAFNLENRMSERADESIAIVQNRADKAVALKARTSPIMETLGGLAIAGAMLFVGSRITDGSVNPGEFVAFLTAFFLAYEPAKKLARLHVSLGGVLVQARLLFDYLDEPNQLEDHPGARDLVVAGGRIACEDLHFSYGEGPVLNGLTLTAMPGEVTALVGPSGAGKSTVFSLIERFVAPNSGRITIDGTDIWDVKAHSLRQHVAFVTQETYLFEGTIAQNIALGSENASPQAIEEAARNAHAHEFILEQEDGYETQVGEGGMKLSGGQRQRVAIARAMLRDAPILLLDEATASLDAESEAKVQEALDRLMADRTTIVIAHRLSTVRNAACIHVMDRGRVIQSGTHDELIGKGGLYATLYNLQFVDGDRGAA
ncbi:MAG: ABC transporter ATP-binding protein [Pseudomonadota bacterium]